MIEKVTLIGLGLMASSVARGLINDKESVKVIGYDISPEVRKIASEIKIFEIRVQRLRKNKKIRSTNSDFKASFKCVMYMTHMHNSL